MDTVTKVHGDIDILFVKLMCDQLNTNLDVQTVVVQYHVWSHSTGS